MNLLEIINAMTWKEYLIFFCIFLGIVNICAWLWLKRSEKKTLRINELISSINKNNGGFIDPIAIMLGMVFVSTMVFFSAPPTVKPKEECNEYTIIQIVDSETLEEKPVKIPKMTQPKKRHKSTCGGK